MNDDLFERILVPIASPDDAEATARALRPHLDTDTTGSVEILFFRQILT
jgi:hypothetical protein